MKFTWPYQKGIQNSLNYVKKTQAERVIYGLVQAARQFFKKICDALLQADFKASEADPCLVYKEDQGTGVCIMLIYIDDMLIV